VEAKVLRKFSISSIAYGVFKKYFCGTLLTGCDDDVL